MPFLSNPKGTKGEHDSSDGRVVLAFASGAEDSGFIPSEVKSITLKLIFAASLVDAQH